MTLQEHLCENITPAIQASPLPRLDNSEIEYLQAVENILDRWITPGGRAERLALAQHRDGFSPEHTANTIGRGFALRRDLSRRSAAQ